MPTTPHSTAPGAPDWRARLVAWSLRLLLAALGATLRLRPLGSDALVDLARSKRPTQLVLWHHQLFLAAWLLRRELVARGVPLVVLVSRSRDGTFGTEVGRLLGARVVRGSSSRGGGAALRTLVRAAAAGGSPLLIPDGPRGPARRCKPGPIALAELARLPTVPLALAADRCWRLRSWDRMVIPKPFARVTVVTGELRPPPRAADDREREAARLALEAELEALTVQATAVR